MTIDRPGADQIPALKRLWQQAFGDTDDFLDSFYSTAYAPDRCLCILLEDRPAAALYWLDCTLQEHKLAYIYAVVTDPAYRGRGLCRVLMESTHDLLRRRGYAGAVLVPQQEGLRAMYAGMGYLPGTTVAEVTCTSGGQSVELELLDGDIRS